YYVTDASFKPGKQITDANPQQKEFAWTSGVKLINYTSAKGDKLQGALYLPANYEPGKKYPLLVTIYEKRSQQANQYVTPSETSTPNRSVYWNTGGTNQAIFESSQGRFKGNVADNTEAYIRNSPVFHAKNVKTPLIILHDDKDGAVDFNQGITYFNALRQLNKDVILLEYVGENHGLARPINQKDYAMRQKDWFDHYLKGAPAPDWMTKGIPRIKMDEYWQSLKAQPATVVP